MRILLTRPAEDAERTTIRLKELGHIPISAPVIEIVGCKSRLPSPSRHDAVIATSSHALKLIERVPREALDLPVYVVGERTARMARSLGWKHVAAVAANSHALCRSVLARDVATSWLYIAGTPRNPRLERTLDRAGRKCCVVVAYEARALDALPLAATTGLSQGEIDAVLHFSERSAAIFLDLVRRARLEQQAAAALHIAISQGVAEALEGFARKLKVAASPDEAGVLNQLEQD